MGMFGFGEIIVNLEQREKREVFTSKVGRLLPSMAEFKASIAPMIRGTALGSFLGILPGGGAALSSFTSLRAGEEALEDP